MTDANLLTGSAAAPLIEPVAPMPEYKTTFGEMGYSDSTPGRVVAPDPKPPEGTGWVMCGSAVAVEDALSYPVTVVLWFWTRTKEVAP
jgi:hypothetical protein